MKKGESIACFSSSTSWGGLEMNLVRWAHWLSEHRTVKIFCQKESQIHQESKRLGLDCAFIDSHMKYYDVRAGWKLSKLLQRENCSQVLFRDTKDMSTLALAKTFSGGRLRLSYFQGMQIGVSKRDFLHTIRFKKIDHWITPLNVLKQEVISNTRFPAERIYVMPLAVDETFKTKRTAIEIRQELQIPMEHTVFGVIGRLDKGKCQDVFLRAFSLLKKENSNIHALIIGDETRNSAHDFKRTLLDIIDENNLSNSVTILPNQNPVVDYMNSLDVLVMSSEAETFGMVTIEGLWLGKIIIGTNSGGTPEILAQGKYGTLVKPKDIDSLKKAMHGVCENSVQFQTKAFSAKEYAQDTFGKTRFIENLLRIIN